MNPEKDIILIKKLIQQLADRGGDTTLTLEAIGRITSKYKFLSDIYDV